MLSAALRSSLPAMLCYFAAYIAQWLQTAKTRHKISSFVVIFHKFSCKQVSAVFKISVSGAFVHFNIQTFVKLLQA